MGPRWDGAAHSCLPACIRPGCPACPAPALVLSLGRMGSIAPACPGHRARRAAWGGEIRGQEQSWRKSVSLDRQDPTGRSAAAPACRVPGDGGSVGRGMPQIQGCPGTGVGTKRPRQLSATSLHGWLLFFLAQGLVCWSMRHSEPTVALPFVCVCVSAHTCALQHVTAVRLGDVTVLLQQPASPRHIPAASVHLAQTICCSEATDVFPSRTFNSVL